MAVQFGRDQAGSGTAGRLCSGWVRHGMARQGAVWQGGHGHVSLGWVRSVEACRGNQQSLY